MPFVPEDTEFGPFFSSYSGELRDISKFHIIVRNVEKLEIYFGIVVSYGKGTLWMALFIHVVIVVAKLLK